MKNENTPEKLSINQWAEDDRPREKLMAIGRHNLTDAELIAILIGSGNSKETAVDLSRRILADNQNNLNELAKKTVAELIKYHGIGEAKAISIVAALEIGRRRQDQAPVERPQIISSRDTYNIMYEHLADVPHEEFWVLFINNANRVIDKTRLSVGSLSATLVDIKIIMKLALEKLATGIVLCHNHPSGNKLPSEQDHTLTARINAACKLLDIRLADHIIFTTDHGFYSFADAGEIKRIN